MKKMMKKRIWKSIMFIIILTFSSSLFVFFVNAEISYFQYSNSSNSKIISENMDLFIESLDLEDWNPERFIDLKEEAQKNILNDDLESFYKICGQFKDISKLAKDSIDSYKLAEKNSHDLMNYDINLDDQKLLDIERAKDHIISSRYENALSLLDEINKFIKEKNNKLYDDILNEIDKITDTLVIDDVNINKISELRKDILSSKINLDVYSINYYNNNIDEIKNAINSIKSSKERIDYFKSKNINSEKLQDIYDQEIYYFEKGGYIKIKNLDEESDSIYKLVDKFYKLYKNNNLKLQKLQNIDDSKVILFFNRLNEINKTFLSGNFDNAYDEINILNEDILDYESSLISKSDNKIIFSINDYIKKNYIVIIISSLTFFMLLYVSRKNITRYMISRESKNKKKEINQIIESIKDIQRQYYQDKSISKRKYDNIIKVYHKKLSNHTKKLAILKEKNKNRR